jgi:hypothetical protein
MCAATFVEDFIRVNPPKRALLKPKKSETWSLTIIILLKLMLIPGVFMMAALDGDSLFGMRLVV